jgi:NAD(P)-dependent dehydrogenase (short-subunit alcohol dehydrogenase family)
MLTRMQPPEPRPLEGKSIVIMGGTRGIGLSAGKAIIRAGARLVAVGLDQESVDKAAVTLGSSALVLRGDAMRPETAVATVAEAIQLNGKLDGLYHVAGGSGRRWGDGPLHELSDEGWRQTLELNLASVMYSNRAAVRQFLAQGSGGAIVNLTSVLAFAPSPKFFATHAYAAAKAAIIGLTKSCAAFYADRNIRCNSLAAGLVATAMSRRAQESEEISKFVRTRQPLAGGRIGQPNDLDGAVVYLLSDAASFVTGQVLVVDGGWTVAEGQ